MLNFLNFLKKTQETSPIDNCPLVSGGTPTPPVEPEKVLNKELADCIENATVLLVDDNRDLLDYVGDVIGDYAKTVYTALDGYKAIEMLTMHPIDVIISDIMMPNMDGYELCHYVKNNILISNIPVILLTARIDAESRNLGYKNGADDYITKPFSETDLVNSISSILKERQHSKEHIANTMSIDASNTFSPVDEDLLNKFHTFILENVSNPDFSVQDIEEQLSMNHTVLFNKIVQLTGLNIINYINRVRLEHAIILMKTTNMSMAEIAKHSGFSSQKYFSTSFKNYTGISPLNYKNSLSFTSD